MKFCTDCKNMLYVIEEAEGGSINLNCRNCPYTEKAPALLYEHNIREDIAAQLESNPYLTQCPTLPRFKTIRCINEQCPTQQSESDIVGVKIDKDNVVWMYKCAVCKTAWKQASHRG
jgi:DNA-directed RNA polymerase subunit M/transcription elongation factor TFIIS